ncbi:MAG: ATP-binding protein [Candidatus Omnitrophica bacterium]|nr:ATP-binding protein [Candidatus Omnitrophota bacterium]
MKVVKVKIKKFRHLHNIELNFGKKLTAIAGQNGTGKSSILGLVGHIFNFSTDYKTLNEKQYSTQCSEIFRFSYPGYDKAKDHDYSVELDTGEKISVLSYDRKERGKKKSLRLRVWKGKQQEEKITYPVIYLGLRRLFPLAQEENVNHKVRKLNRDQIQEYQNLHNEILLLNEKISPEYVETFSKNFYAPKTDQYDCLGNSAGQDNLGQILTATLSFEKLKELMRDSYSGGILFIDELDATLYPAAQIKLIERLFRIAQDLDLQVIFTTHSTDVVETMMSSRYKQHSKVVYLTSDSGKVENVQDEITIDEIINNLKVKLPTRKKTEKMMVFCEDKEAKLWIANLLGTKITKHVSFIKDTFGGGELVKIANKKIPVFKNSIFVLDGDQNKTLKRNRCPRVILLPGDTRPENIFHEFLTNLLPNDEFWESTGGYTKQFCFRDCPRIHNDRKVMKNWFNNQVPQWGRGCSKLFNRWKKEYPVEANQFKAEFEDIIKQLTN